MQAIENQAEETTSGDQAREESMAAIKGLVLEAEPVEGGQGGGASEGVLIDPVDEARELIAFALSLFSPLYPSLDIVWLPSVQERVALAATPLMQKYGLTLGVMFEKWGAEIRFAMVALPVGGATIKAIKHDNAVRAAEADADADAKRAADNANQ